MFSSSLQHTFAFKFQFRLSFKGKAWVFLQFLVEAHCQEYCLVHLPELSCEQLYLWRLPLKINLPLFSSNFGRASTRLFSTVYCSIWVRKRYLVNFVVMVLHSFLHPSSISVKKKFLCFNFHSTYLFQTTPIHQLPNPVSWGVKCHSRTYLALYSQIILLTWLVSYYSSLNCQQLKYIIFIMQFLQINITFQRYCIRIQLITITVPFAFSPTYTAGLYLQVRPVLESYIATIWMMILLFKNNVCLNVKIWVQRYFRQRLLNSFTAWNIYTII